MNRTDDAALGALRRYFGHDAFREGQRQLVDALASGRDVLGVMPTGAGKSVCYQIPAVLAEGVTIVVSPLISLMADQVGALGEAGIPSAYINSSLSQSEMSHRRMLAADGAYKILYVAPERFDSEEFVALARSLTIPLVAVDEAHCVSQWGNDFRPSYSRIADFVSRLDRRPVIGAFTATATSQVRDDVISLLGLRDPLVITTGFDRPNLYFSVREPKNKAAALVRFVKERPGRSGIVYCSTRKNVEAVCDALREAGVAATRDHAGLSDEERAANQNDFIYDRADVIAATNAFGMGIDKSDVAYVVHYNMPKCMENYYQEAGRAGRDGSRAECVLFYSGSDVFTNRFLIEHGDADADDALRSELRDRDLERLNRMVAYCKTQSCLRAYILRYFGDRPETDRCENCSVCDSEYEERNITVEAQKIMSCVVRSGQRFGATVITNCLLGKPSDKSSAAGLDRLTTFGIMAGGASADIRMIIDYLVDCGLLVSEGDRYPVLRVGDGADAVLRGGARVIMRIPVERAAERAEKRIRAGKKAKPSVRSAGKAPTAAVAHEGSAQDSGDLYERLRALRRELATKAGLPAYVIFTDAALRDMCEQMPRNKLEFLEVSGVGQAKCDRYAVPFLAEINKEET